MHHRPWYICRRQRRFQLSFVAAAALEHDDVARRIQSSHQSRDCRGFIHVPLDLRRVLTCHIEPPLADIDPNHSLAVHADLHHVSRVRTAHAIVSGRRAPSTVRVPDRRDAGGPPDQHGRKDLPGPRGPAGGCLLTKTAPTYNPGSPRSRTIPGLQRITSLRSVLRCARDTRDEGAAAHSLTSLAIVNTVAGVGTRRARADCSRPNIAEGGFR